MHNLYVQSLDLFDLCIKNKFSKLIGYVDTPPLSSTFCFDIQSYLLQCSSVKPLSKLRHFRSEKL